MEPHIATSLEVLRETLRRTADRDTSENGRIRHVYVQAAPNRVTAVLFVTADDLDAALRVGRRAAIEVEFSTRSLRTVSVEPIDCPPEPR